jgi:hypothetical protein
MSHQPIAQLDARVEELLRPLRTNERDEDEELGMGAVICNVFF